MGSPEPGHVHGHAVPAYSSFSAANPDTVCPPISDSVVHDRERLTQGRVPTRMALPPVVVGG